MAENQHLNSLGRFRKQPGRLVLEEHSHCEVPTGCGGVVLRWRNPHAVLPVTMHLYTPVRATLLVDGKEPRGCHRSASPSHPGLPGPGESGSGRLAVVRSVLRR